MPREHPDYRANIELLNQRFPDHDMLTREEVLQVTGYKNMNIDMCIVDSADRKALLRVSNPPMDPRLWSIERTDQHQRWVEESADEHS